ncbi:unnamed protein product [Prorocentrum cordatum]|uniref:Uncharacterized protein n=1 Tax=Prorocentrum cordatum TaxID=2364126 RepID=A0ABN9RVK5_9DINO|nr:unnamed protein product [Polarella glacialis]
MRPSCTAQLAEVFSPLEARGGRGGADEPAEAGAETGGGWDGRWRQPLVVDEGHFSREALWRLHLAAVRAVRAVPRRRRLCLELVLLGVVLAHVCALVALHASLLASPLSGGGALAHSEALLSALRARHPAGGDGATDAHDSEENKVPIPLFALETLVATAGFSSKFWTLRVSPGSLDACTDVAMF